MAVHQLVTSDNRDTRPHKGPSRAPDEGDGGVSIERLLAILKRRRAFILRLTAIGTVLAYIAGWAITTTYTATAALLVESTDSSFFDFLDDSGPEGTMPDRVATEIELITSRSHLERVMSQMELYDDPEFRPGGHDGVPSVEIDLPEPLRSVAKLLPDSWLIQTGIATEASPPSATQAPVARSALALDRFRHKLDVEQQGSTPVINVSVTVSDPEKAAAIANGIVASYVESQVEYKRNAATRAASWIETRLAELEDTVQQTEREAAQYQAQEGLDPRPGGGTITDQRVFDLNNQLIAVQSARAALEAKLGQAQALRQGGARADELVDVLNTPLLFSLRSEEVAVQRRLAQLRQTFGPNHPQMVAAETELTDVRDRIALESVRALRSLVDELAVVEGREAIIKEQLATMQQASAEDRQASVHLRELERQAQANRELYEMFLRQYKETQERVRSMVPDARVISNAVAPSEATTPGPLVLAMIGFTVSAMFSSLLAFLLESLDDTVQSGESIERALGLTMLGVLPLIRDREARQSPGRYIAKRPFTTFAEAAQSIITALATPRDGSGSGSRVVLVTSALPNEGKTTLSLSLATAATRLGHKPLLIDLDLRRPTLNASHGDAEWAPGLVDYLQGRLARDELVQHDDESGIDFVAVGEPPTNPLELLRSPRLFHLFEGWRDEYDQIIIDSAPILAVTDTKVAAALADRVVLAARWKHTEIGALSHAVRVILEVDAEIAGCVLTAVDMEKYKLYASNEGAAYYRKYRSYYLE
jgi:succinoglycan biosynthesis transport protein ExoP